MFKDLLVCSSCLIIARCGADTHLLIVGPVGFDSSVSRMMFRLCPVTLFILKFSHQDLWLSLCACPDTYDIFIHPGSDSQFFSVYCWQLDPVFEVLVKTQAVYECFGSGSSYWRSLTCLLCSCRFWFCHFCFKNEYLDLCIILSITHMLFNEHAALYKTYWRSDWDQMTAVRIISVLSVVSMQRLRLNPCTSKVKYIWDQGFLLSWDYFSQFLLRAHTEMLI